MTVPADIQIAELTAADIDDVWEFFQKVPEGDRTFFKEPVSERDTVRGWTEANGDRRFVARAAERVVGYVALIPGVGWSRHVAELRLVVDPGLRRQGVGQRLARHTLRVALESGLTKVTVEVIAEQESTIALFTRLGFAPKPCSRTTSRIRRAASVTSSSSPIAPTSTGACSRRSDSTSPSSRECCLM